MKLYKKLIYLILFFLISITNNILSQDSFLKVVVALTGNIYNEVTLEPVTVFIKVFDENGNRVASTRSNSAENGYYYITGLKPGKKYTLNITQQDFFKEIHQIEIPLTDRYVEISRDFVVKPLVVGAKLMLIVPPFELNKSKLRYGAEMILDDYKNSYINNPEVNFEIQCYPDNDENKSENQKLTEERCQAIKNYFVSNGIDSSRITIKSFNTTDPKNPPPTKKRAKGKRYIGSTYFVITKI